MQEEFRRSFLKDIKKLVSKRKFQLINRHKNVDFMKLYFLDDDDLIEIILALSPSDCTDGPEPDRGGYEGHILEFKSSYLDGKLIYVKIRYCPPDKVVIISFHEDE
jgi:hypothetical protein